MHESLGSQRDSFVMAAPNAANHFIAVNVIAKGA